MIRKQMLTSDSPDARLAKCAMPKLFKAQFRHASHYKNILLTANQLYEQGGIALQQGLSLLYSEWDNIEAGHTWAEAHASENKTAASLCSSYQIVGGHVLS